MWKKVGTFSRKAHRLVAVISAVFLLAITVTGVLLSIQKLQGVADNAREEREAKGTKFELESSLSGFMPKLARAQAAVRAKVGNEKLARVDLELQGEHPIFIFHTAGKDKDNDEVAGKDNDQDETQQFVVNADTGVIQGNDAEDKSLWERLHGGEILGDYGVAFNLVFGLVLLFLILTGLAMYGQILSVRRKSGDWSEKNLAQTAAKEASGERTGDRQV